MENTDRKIISIPFALLSIIIIITPLFAGGSTYLPVALVRILTFTTFAAMLFRKYKEKEKKIVNISFEGILLFALISLPLIYTFYNTACFYDSLQWSISVLTFFSLFCVSSYCLKNWNNRNLIIIMLIIISSAEALAGIIQFFFLSMLRAKGTFYNPNHYGLFLAVCSVIIISNLLFAEKKSDRNYSKLILVAALILNISGILFSASKGVSLSFLLVLLIMLFYRFKVRGLIVFLVIITTIVIIPNPLSHRVEIALNYDIFGLSRINIWQSALEMFRDNPPGIGPAMFKYYFYRYNFPVNEGIAIFGNHAKTAHNEYLQFMVESGIPGVILAAALFLIFSLRLFQRIKKEKNAFLKNDFAAFFFAALLIMFHSVTDSSLHDYTSAIMLSLFGGLIWPVEDKKNYIASFQISRFFAPIMLIPSIVVIALCSFLFAGQYYSDLGVRQNRLADYESAEKNLKRSVSLIPFSPSSFNALANVKINRFIESGKFEDLQSAFLYESNAMALNPMNPYYPFYCGKIMKTIFFETKNPLYLEKSLFFLEKAQSINPYNPFYKLETASVYLIAQRNEKAVKTLENTLKIEPLFLPASEMLYNLYEDERKADIINKISWQMKKLEAKKKQLKNLTPYERLFFKISPKIKKKIK